MNEPASAFDAAALDRLKEAARAAAAHAHAPYSGFCVGAAALGADGSVHAGCNVENASYGLTICAERNAIAAAILAGEKELRALAIYTPTETLTPPCGACRQVLAEFCPGGDLEIHLFNDRGGHMFHRLADLFPHPFQL